MAEGRVVGIDLGTTNSLVAYMQGDTPVVIPGVDGSNLVPSVVALDPIASKGGRPTVTVGNSARKALIQPAHGHRWQQCAEGSYRDAGAGYLLRKAADGPRAWRNPGGIEAVSLPPGGGY